MAKCPECDGELVRSATKKKGMDVLKHADPAAAKAAGCGVSFIPARTKVVNSGGEKEIPKVEKTKEPEATSQRSGKSGYREAVARSGRAAGRGKTGGRSNRQSPEPVQQASSSGSGTGTPAKSDKPSGSFARGFFDDVTDTIFGKRK